MSELLLTFLLFWASSLSCSIYFSGYASTMARGGSSNGGWGNHHPIDEIVAIDDLSSPSFLHNGDHPRMNLVSHPLTGANYHTWRRAMLMALTAKKKIGFVDGTIPRPNSNDIMYNARCRCNSMVFSWIINTVAKDIANSLLYLDFANDIGNIFVIDSFKEMDLEFSRSRSFCLDYHKVHWM